MTTRRTRPVITVVDARPMSEVGFPGVAAEQPRSAANRPTLPVTNNIADSNQTTASNAIQTQRPAVALQEAKAPLLGSSKTQQNPNAEPRPVAAPRPESKTKPRPKSVMITKAVSLFEIKMSLDDQMPLPTDRPAISNRPTIIRPKPNTALRSSEQTVAASYKTNIQQPPPVIKPKPAALQRRASLTELSAEVKKDAAVDSPVMVNKWKKPTIIRPSGSNDILNSSQTLQQHQHEASVPLPRPRQQQPSSEVEKERWTKPTQPSPTSEMSWTNKETIEVNRSGFDESATTSLQAKSKPTIIKRNKTPASDSVLERAADISILKAQRDQLVASQTIEELNSINHSIDSKREVPPNIVLTQSAVSYHVETSRSVEAASSSVETSWSRSVETETSWSREATSHSVKPSRSRETLEETVHQQVKSLPPAKPPPPKIKTGLLSSSNASSSHAIKTVEESEKHLQDARLKEQPLPVSVGSSGPRQRPSVRSREHKGSAPQLPPRPTQGHPLYHYVYEGPRALALFDYVAAQSDELSFCAGDVIILEKWITAEWISGSAGTKHGMFPVNFVEIIEPLPIDPSMPAMKTSSKEAISTKTTSQSDRLFGPRCLARFDYMTDEVDDLSFTAGDVIGLVERVSDEWMRGKLNGKTGLFPLAFVEVLEDLPAGSVGADHKSVLNACTTNTAQPQFDKNNGSQPYCIAEFDFDGQSPEDLSFVTGDRIQLLERINPEWLKGRIDGRQGIFPSAFVQIIHDLQELPRRPKSITRPNSQLSDVVADCSAGQMRAVALYDFDGDLAAGDLCFRAGDKLDDLTTVSEEWMSGRIGQRTGIFPSSFVRIT